MNHAAIYLVANRRSECDFSNLVRSIRSSGCTIPIALIPFDGDRIRDKTLLKEVQVMEPEEFPIEAREFVAELTETLAQCPGGFLRRFLAFWGPYERFIYSDNDIVALSNWHDWLGILGDHDLLHADEEYRTKGKYNFTRPSGLEEAFGEGALEAAITAGHFAVRRSDKLVDDMRTALQWMKENSEICKMHDQTLVHVASILGQWDCLNLCKPPHQWLSSWAGDYESPLELIHAGQAGRRISHLHFSGYGPHSFSRAVDPIRTSFLSDKDRNRLLLIEQIRAISGYNEGLRLWKRLKQKIVKK